jgi:hypothetical protein
MATPGKDGYMRSFLIALSLVWFVFSFVFVLALAAAASRRRPKPDPRPNTAVIPEPAASSDPPKQPLVVEPLPWFRAWKPIRSPGRDIRKAVRRFAHPCRTGERKWPMSIRSLKR